MYIHMYVQLDREIKRQIYRLMDAIGMCTEMNQWYGAKEKRMRKKKKNYKEAKIEEDEEESEREREDKRQQNESKEKTEEYETMKAFRIEDKNVDEVCTGCHKNHLVGLFEDYRKIPQLIQSVVHWPSQQKDCAELKISVKRPTRSRGSRVRIDSSSSD